MPGDVDPSLCPKESERGRERERERETGRPLWASEQIAFVGHESAMQHAPPKQSYRPHSAMLDKKSLTTSVSWLAPAEDGSSSRSALSVLRQGMLER